MTTSRLLELIVVQLRTQRALATPLEQVVLDDLIAETRAREAQLARLEQLEAAS